MLLQANQLYKSYKPKGEFSINGCGTPIIEAQNDIQKLNVDFAVKNISLTVDKSEVISILGSNGSGKSTLLKILAGLMEPDFGEVIYKKKQVYCSVKKLIAGHDKIKLIHQNFNLFPNISLAENIAYSLRFHTQDFQKKRLTELLELCDLESIKEKLPRNASGGEQQRTAIATALASDAEVLLFDEPFASLDVFNKTELKSHIKTIARKSKVGIVLVTHDAHDALSISDKLMVMSNGSFVQTDSPEIIYYKPSTVYIAKLTGLANILNYSTLHHLLQKHSFIKKAKIRYCIRPENIKIIHNEASTSIVKDSFFHGDFWLLKIQTESKTIITAKTLQPYIIGQRVSIDFNENCVVEVNESNLDLI